MASVQVHIKHKGLATLRQLYTQDLYANQTSKKSKILVKEESQGWIYTF